MNNHIIYSVKKNNIDNKKNDTNISIENKDQNEKNSIQDKKTNINNANRFYIILDRIREITREEYLEMFVR